MKRYYLLVTLLILSLNNFGQSYGNIWYFANNAGINFNGCNPVVLTNGADSSSAGEGSSTICDNSGQLLFYTNSDKVWNKNHVVMPNGNIFNSNGSLSQVIIIPKPLSSSIYYIITTEFQGAMITPKTMQYHIVDMSLNGGLGDVSSKNNLLTSDTTTEQVAATFHGNGTDIWVVTHGYPNNKFLAYLVSSTGISTTPVISAVGSSQTSTTSNINARGSIKISPDGNKLAFNANGTGGNIPSNILELFDFNKSTGVVSNPISLPFKQGEYGLSFSPDNSKLYCATLKAFSFTTSDSNFVYQFDLSSGVPATIINSRTVINSTSFFNQFGSLQIGPDGKIYVGKLSSTSLDVINNPNSSGLSCNYTPNGLFLAGKTGMYGLNNYIEYTNYCSGTNIPDFYYSSNSLTISPNPAQQYFIVDLPKEQNFSLLIYDVTGRIMNEIKNATGTVKVDCSNLGSGIYFVKAVNQRTVLTGKLIKE